MPTPDRPRLEHCGRTVESLEAATALYGPLGCRNSGTLVFDDDRGFRIDFLRSRGTVLEVFTFTAPTTRVPAECDRFGFAALDVGPVPGGLRLTVLPDGRPVAVDPDELPLIAVSLRA